MIDVQSGQAEPKNLEERLVRERERKTAIKTLANKYRYYF
jgi:hypothetical protein